MDLRSKTIFLPEPHEIDGGAKSLLIKAGYELTSDPSKTEVVGIFIKTNTILNKGYLDRYNNLKFIIRAGVGLDNIDIAECQNRSIQVFNSPLSNSNSVAEYVVFLALLINRKYEHQKLELKSGNWRNIDYMGNEIRGKTVGLVGSGNIGKIVASYFTVLGTAKILSYDPFLDKDVLSSFGIEKCELEDVFSMSDIVSLHLPLNNDTKNLIGKKHLELMKPNSILINTARGGILDETALIKFLKTNTNVNFALDVFENEPNINKQLLEFKNIIATPHIAAYTQEAQERMSIQAVDNFFLKYKDN